MNFPQVLKGVEKLHANAKNGSAKINGIQYHFKFDGHNYNVFKGTEEKSFVTFNTRLLSTAKKWLKEWLNN